MNTPFSIVLLITSKVFSFYCYVRSFDGIDNNVH